MIYDACTGTVLLTKDKMSQIQKAAAKNGIALTEIRTLQDAWLAASAVSPSPLVADLVALVRSAQFVMPATSRRQAMVTDLTNKRLSA